MTQTPVRSQAQIDAFRSEGYLVIRGALTAQEARHFADLVLNLVPRDLSVPDHWEAVDGRVKPFFTPGNQTFDSPEFLPLFQNEHLYEVAAQLLGHERLHVRDGSLAVTLRNDSAQRGPLSQPLHLDPAVPEDLEQFLFTEDEVEVGGCFYLTDVEPGGGAIHVVPGGHRIVEDEARASACGRQLHDKWRDIRHLDTVEVTGGAGDFVMMHHLMPHAASHNRRSTARVAQFLRWARADQPHRSRYRPGDLSDEHSFNDLQIAAMTPLGRRLLGVTAWDGATGGYGGDQ